MEQVNHPPHYNNHPSGVECIDIVRHENFNIGNAIKYIWRRKDKGSEVENLEKAIWYLQDEVRRLEAVFPEEQVHYLDEEKEPEKPKFQFTPPWERAPEWARYFAFDAMVHEPNILSGYWYDKMPVYDEDRHYWHRVGLAQRDGEYTRDRVRATTDMIWTRP